MKLKTILLMLFAAAAMGGCIAIGDPPPAPAYYIYGNATEWDIRVECFTKIADDDADSAYRKDTSFVIAPGKEFTLMFSVGHIFSPFKFKGSYDGRYLIYTNGEKTFRQDAYAPYGCRNTLFKEENYEVVSESLDGYYYKFVFTNEDFADHLRPIKY